MLGNFVLRSHYFHSCLVSLLFHIGLGGCVILLGARWVRSQAWKQGTSAWAAGLARDGVTFGIALSAGALLAGVLMPARVSLPFAVLRLLCQGLFGEGIALAVFVTALHVRHRAGRRAAIAALPALLLLAVYVEAYHHEPRNLQVHSHTLDLSHGRGDARELRVLHLSDFQTHRIGAFERRVIQRAREQQADLIVFTGDYIQERLARTGARTQQEFTDLLRRERLQAPLGVFAVGGDVENEGWQQMFAGTGVTILHNRATRIALPGGRYLTLIGLDLATSVGEDRQTIQRLLDTARPGDLRLVIGHRPDFVRALAGRDAVDLALAGHTHGGQVVLPFLGAPVTLSRLPRRYGGGLNDYQGVPLHICRGTGMQRHIAPQVRFLCPPEICTLRVRY